MVRAAIVVLAIAIALALAGPEMMEEVVAGSEEQIAEQERAGREGELDAARELFREQVDQVEGEGDEAKAIWERMKRDARERSVKADALAADMQRNGTMPVGNGRTNMTVLDRAVLASGLFTTEQKTVLTEQAIAEDIRDLE
eukprot:TRINITY_DN969_c0_g1_i16.p1 TRINITY_DN969_c0_g1~~TRINITY_DN969_c0_g1_i16.p1  ORF type:complete len:142 (+),score=48.85 TRINITY_DN969_c0_g1_i16:128-553(+)